MKNLMDKLNNLPKGVQLVLAVIIFAVMFAMLDLIYLHLVNKYHV